MSNHPVIIDFQGHVWSAWRGLRLWKMPLKAAKLRRYAVLKTIAAFLNTDGGTLLIGVADDGSIVGIELDRFEDNDKFLLFLKDKIKRTLEIYPSTFVDFEIGSIHEKSVCVVKCQKSSSPVYLQSKGGIDEFYVRVGPSSEKLPIRDISKYINVRFHP